MAAEPDSIVLRYLRELPTRLLGRKRSINIGGHTLRLDLRLRQERRYFKTARLGRKDVDTLIAERFMRPGDIVLDAGANIGFLTLRYLELGAAEVHAVEPVERLYARLSALDDPRIFTYRAALSDSEGTADIFLSQDHDQGHTLNTALLSRFPKVFGRTPRLETVPLATADALFPTASFDFIKVDIEGSERTFLAGAEQILSERPPRAMQIEIYSSEFREVDAILRRYFPFAWRVAYDRERQCLAYLDPAEAPPAGLKMGSPIYVYSRAGYAV